MNKKILIIAAHSGRGFVHVDKLLPSLVELGYDVTFYGWDREKVFPRYSLENGIKFKMIYRGWGFANKGLIIGIPFFMLKMTYELMFINKKDFPIIMAIDFDAALPQSISIVVNRIETWNAVKILSENLRVGKYNPKPRKSKVWQIGSR